MSLVAVACDIVDEAAEEYFTEEGIGATIQKFAIALRKVSEPLRLLRSERTHPLPMQRQKMVNAATNTNQTQKKKTTEKP